MYFLPQDKLQTFKPTIISLQQGVKWVILQLMVLAWLWFISILTNNQTTHHIATQAKYLLGYTHHPDMVFA